MQKPNSTTTKSLSTLFLSYFFVAVGALLAALALDVFFIPNNLVDGGVVGIAMIFGDLFGRWIFPYLYVLLNLPFLYLAYRWIGKGFLIHFACASLLFFGSLILVGKAMSMGLIEEFHGDSLEVVMSAGALLGIGLGLIIRYGGCLDGTEILGIVVNRRMGFTVGQVVLFCNIFVFAMLGLVKHDWHPALLSMITYIVVIKIMDSVIVGLDEMKSVWIISAKSQQIAKAIVHELGLGLTVMYGRGGFSGEAREVLYVIAERLQLAELKDLVQREDPSAFVAIEDIHEVANGSQLGAAAKKQSKVETLMMRIFKS
jgi:uncharacterized membrane-anchored protein YitT (DUF2179 family)